MDLALIESSNQNRNQHDDFTKEQQLYLLKSITHVMDCECFIVDGHVIYREISICDLNKKMFKPINFTIFFFRNFKT